MSGMRGPSQVLASSRYRHPGDVIRLIAGGLVLACLLVVSAAASKWLLGPDAPFVTGLGSEFAGSVVTGIVQVAFVAAAVLMGAATLRQGRFRLFIGLAVAGGVAAAATVGILLLVGGPHPEELTAHRARSSWVASAAFPGPALIASAVAVVTPAAPWLSRSWRRAAWLAVLLGVAARVLTGAIMPMELLLALATGMTVGAAVLVTLGVPDRRLGPDEIAAALRRAGVGVASVSPAGVEAKGSRPFLARAEGGRRLFIKALGSDQRDDDLLYRAYRAVRLRDVGDTRPARSSRPLSIRRSSVSWLSARASRSQVSIGWSGPATEAAFS